MDRLDTLYQNAVDQEVDRLARLSPVELMHLQPKSWQVTTELEVVTLTVFICDGSDHRRIAVVAGRDGFLGFGRRTFVGALRVQLSSERLSSEEAASLYD